jgi:HEPN domain-containing protein
MKKTTENWLKIAEKDLKFAKLCLDAAEPLGVITHLHASVEKILKAICEENIGLPPKTHSLKKLALDICKLNLEKKQIQLISLLDEAFMDSRYPEDITLFEEEFNIEVCKEIFTETKETIKCLNNLLQKN